MEKVGLITHNDLILVVKNEESGVIRTPKILPANPTD